MHYAACPGTGTGNTVTLAEPLPVACDGGATALETLGSSQPMHDWTWQYGARPTPGKKVRIVSMAPALRLTVKIRRRTRRTATTTGPMASIRRRRPSLCRRTSR